MQILAIDLGKFSSVACLFCKESGTHRFQKFVTQREMLGLLLATEQPDLVVIESCNLAGWVVDLCREREVEVIVASANGDAWKWKKVKRKTDRDDALKIARLAALGQLTPVHTPVSKVRQQRALINHRKSLVGHRTRLRNQVRGLLTAHGLAMPQGSRAWSQSGIAALRELARPLSDCEADELWRGQLQLHLEGLQNISQQIQTVEKKLDELGAKNVQVRRLETIAGVGRRTAETIVAWIDDPYRFKNGRQVSAYAGLVPKQFESGTMSRQGRITCHGPKPLRAALVEAAWVMLQYNDWARETYARIKGQQKTRKKQAIVALARKLLVRCWAMMRSQQAWRATAPT